MSRHIVMQSEIYLCFIVEKRWLVDILDRLSLEKHLERSISQLMVVLDIVVIYHDDQYRVYEDP